MPQNTNRATTLVVLNTLLLKSYRYPKWLVAIITLNIILNMFCFLQILSRSKPALAAGSAEVARKNQGDKTTSQFEEFLFKRDYTGAITLLEVISRAF